METNYAKKGYSPYTHHFKCSFMSVCFRLIVVTNRDAGTVALDELGTDGRSKWVQTHIGLALVCEFESIF